MNQALFDTRMLAEFKDRFGEQAAFNQPLAKYTSARIGGPADVLLTASSADQLAEMVLLVWQMGVPYLIMGGGSNMLVSDASYQSHGKVNKFLNWLNQGLTEFEVRQERFKVRPEVEFVVAP